MVIRTDGLCQPRNPGGYGCWAWVTYDGRGQEVDYNYGSLGIGSTNNIAEAAAVLKALQWALARDCRGVQLETDSELIVRQIRREYRVRAPHLQPMIVEAQRLLADVRGSIGWIPRARNVRADALTKQAYLEATDQSDTTRRSTPDAPSLLRLPAQAPGPHYLSRYLNPVPDSGGGACPADA
jgi:ribonuclease HI